MRRLSLGSRLALLFAACTAVVSLTAGVLFSRASQHHFIELDQQLLESRLSVLRQMLDGVHDPASLATRLPALQSELSHQARPCGTGSRQQWTGMVRQPGQSARLPPGTRAEHLA